MSYRPSLLLAVISLTLAYACSSQVVQEKSSSSSTGTSGAGGSPGSTVTTTSSSSISQGTGGINEPGACTPAQLKARRAAMLEEPIMLPGKAAGLDIVGYANMGLTVPQAELINCPCDPNPGTGGAGGAGGGPSTSGLCMFGGDVWAGYDTTTQIIQAMTLWPGYVGSLAMTSRDGKDQFQLYINQQSTKNGQPYTLDWSLPVGAQFGAELNEIYDALIATYAPSLPPDPQCQAGGHCIVGAFGQEAYVSFPQLGLSLWVQDWSVPQPTPSIFTRMDLYAK